MKKNDYMESICKSELTYLFTRHTEIVETVYIYANIYNEENIYAKFSECHKRSLTSYHFIECVERFSKQMIFGALNSDMLSETAKNASQYFDDIEYFEKKALFLCIRGQVELNYARTVEHNLEKGGDDALWAMKVQAVEFYMLKELASLALWREIVKYYDLETNNITQYIRGEIDKILYNNNKKNNKEIFIAEYNLLKHRELELVKVFDKYHNICRELSNKIIINAKSQTTK
jgi:hypothetical protein